MIAASIFATIKVLLSRKFSFGIPCKKDQEITLTLFLSDYIYSFIILFCHFTYKLKSLTDEYSHHIKSILTSLHNNNPLYFYLHSES